MRMCAVTQRCTCFPRIPQCIAHMHVHIGSSHMRTDLSKPHHATKEKSDITPDPNGHGNHTMQPHHAVPFGERPSLPHRAARAKPHRAVPATSCRPRAHRELWPTDCARMPLASVQSCKRSSRAASPPATMHAAMYATMPLACSSTTLSVSPRHGLCSVARLPATPERPKRSRERPERLESIPNPKRLMKHHWCCS